MAIKSYKNVEGWEANRKGRWLDVVTFLKTMEWSDELDCPIIYVMGFQTITEFQEGGFGEKVRPVLVQDGTVDDSLNQLIEKLKTNGVNNVLNGTEISEEFFDLTNAVEI